MKGNQFTDLEFIARWVRFPNTDGTWISVANASNKSNVAINQVSLLEKRKRKRFESNRKSVVLIDYLSCPSMKKFEVILQNLPTRHAMFAAENLAPSFQAANLNETEEAALFIVYCCGIQVPPPKLLRSPSVFNCNNIYSIFSGSRYVCRRKAGGRDATSTNTERFESILRIRRQWFISSIGQSLSTVRTDARIHAY